jgi:hypothetical protein
MSIREAQIRAMKKALKLTDGWKDSKTVAKELKCSTGDIRNNLRYGLADGSIQCEVRLVWDEPLQRGVKQYCYRTTPVKLAKSPKKAA